MVGAPPRPRVYHRRASPTQTPEDAARQKASGELWGRPPLGSTIPAVQAYVGPLPPGAQGIEFATDVVPDPGAPPGQAYWRGPRAGVTVDNDVAMIRIVITRNAYR